jgi:hypothetical protein
MKFTLLAGCLLPLFLAAQDAKECKIIREKDPYTKETRLSSGFITLEGGTVTVEADKTEIDFFFVIPDKCFNDDMSVQVFFEGSKTKTTFRNAGSMNCDGYFHVKFRNGLVTPTAVKNLSTKKATQFIFNPQDKKPLVITLRPEQQELFMNAAACMAEEAKTLLNK